MQVVLLLIFGLIGGILGGMGMGGGTLLIPLLTIGLNLTQQSSQAINLLAFLPMSIVALVIHFKNKLVHTKIAIPIAISGVASSILGSFLANKTSSFTLKIWFGIFLIIVGILQIYSLWLTKNNTPQSKQYKNSNVKLKNKAK